MYWAISELLGAMVQDSASHFQEAPRFPGRQRCLAVGSIKIPNWMWWHTAAISAPRSRGQPVMHLGSISKTRQNTTKSAISRSNPQLCLTLDSSSLVSSFVKQGQKSQPLPHGTVERSKSYKVCKLFIRAWPQIGARPMWVFFSIGCLFERLSGVNSINFSSFLHGS